MSITKFKGQPVQIAGEFVKAGAAAPDFELVKTDLSTLLVRAEKVYYFDTSL